MSRRENEQVREDSTLNDWNMAGNLHTIKKKIFLYFFVPHSFLDCSCSHLYDLTLNNLSSAKLTNTFKQVHIVKLKKFP